MLKQKIRTQIPIERLAEKHEKKKKKIKYNYKSKSTMFGQEEYKNALFQLR